MNVVIYARFSCHRQTEQSIEGQLKVCYDYAKANDYTVIGEYIDRAQSGTTDNRPEFKRMIADSEKHTFEGVLVYQLDRFARDRYASATYKYKLRKNGVRVISAREPITDDASGILVEGLLESMAEYYSVELSQKIRRGHSINASKCLSNGSNPGLGYKVNKEDRSFYVDEFEAAIVREIYERYARGEPKTDIIKDLNRRQLKTSIGNPFSLTSLTRLLTNKRYIGYYLYSGKEIPDGMPRIIEDDLFYRVQENLDRNRHAQAKKKGDDAYILTTKLFCGHCKEMMVGVCGTGKSGAIYNYYVCKDARKKKCDKKSINKQFIEDLVINECLKLLTEEKKLYIAKKVSEECSQNPDNLSIKYLKRSIKEIDDAIENMWISIEKGGDAVSLTERINRRQEEKAKLEEQLAVEQNKRVILTEAQVLAFLDYVSDLNGNDVMKRTAIINIFVHSIYLYDDHLTLIINGSNKPVTVDDIPFDEIEAAFSSAGAEESCSNTSDNVPPNKKSRTKVWLFFFCSIHYSFVLCDFS